MNRTLDIAPLRSFVAVADCGGFHRAAEALHLSQGAISQHVRRLESAVGHPLVVRHGRGSRFTTEGEKLLDHARRILAAHDETMSGFDAAATATVVVGSTEHAAAQMLPYLATELERSVPEFRVRFRIDRGARLREGLNTGRIDLALLLGPADSPRATPVGELELTWYSSPGWARPSADAPVPVVAFDSPCALRTSALDTLSAHGIPAVIGAEAIQLAGVHAAVQAGVGVALLATLGQTPEGLVAREDLPKSAPLPLAVWARDGLNPVIAKRAAAALRALLEAPADRIPDARGLQLATGA
jgi:DNA-binding transcriptional LysR family regulator